MNTYNKSGPGISGRAFDNWVQKSTVHDDSAITKMQHQYWVTKQALSRKLGKKEDECILASDAELDAKLELFHSVQESCSFLQRVIDKYQERICNLAQEENAMGRFLKEAAKEDKTRAGEIMLAVGKSLSYSGQKRLALRVPLGRLYQEVETFRQRAIEDTLQNVQAMEKARTEYRAALSWMKNISQELDPDTSKQLERFRKVQMRVRQGKSQFDHLAFDCLQKVDLLAAARCNMFSHALVLYQSTLLNFTRKSAQAYSMIADTFKGHQRYNFMVVRELAETSSKLAQETGSNDDSDDKDKLAFFDTDYHDEIEQGEEAQPNPENGSSKFKTGEELLDLDSDSKDILDLPDLNTSASKNGIRQNFDKAKHDDTKELDQFFQELALESSKKTSANAEKNHSKSHKKLHDLNMDIFNDRSSSSDHANLSCMDLGASSQSNLNIYNSETAALLDDLLSDKHVATDEWEDLSHDSFLPPNILKQSLGDAARGIGQKNLFTNNTDDKKKGKSGKQKGNSWLDLFAELDPLANNPMEKLSGDSNASA